MVVDQKISIRFNSVGSDPVDEEKPFTVIAIIPEVGWLDVHVIDVEGNPVPDARVELNGYVDYTNFDGRVTIEAPEGTYTLTVSKTGYRTYTESVTIIAGETFTVEVVLEKEVVPPIPPEWIIGVLAILGIAGAAVSYPVIREELRKRGYE